MLSRILAVIRADRRSTRCIRNEAWKGKVKEDVRALSALQFDSPGIRQGGEKRFEAAVETLADPATPLTLVDVLLDDSADAVAAAACAALARRPDGGVASDHLIRCLWRFGVGVHPYALAGLERAPKAVVGRVVTTVPDRWLEEPTLTMLRQFVRRRLEEGETISFDFPNGDRTSSAPRLVAALSADLGREACDDFQRWLRQDGSVESRPEVAVKLDAGAGGLLWPANDQAFSRFGLGLIDIDALPISSKLRAELEDLSARYDSSINWADPREPSPWTEQEWDGFDRQLTHTIAALASELEPEVVVTCDGRAVGPEPRRSKEDSVGALARIRPYVRLMEQAARGELDQSSFRTAAFRLFRESPATFGERSFEVLCGVLRNDEDRFLGQCSESVSDTETSFQARAASALEQLEFRG